MRVFAFGHAAFEDVGRIGPVLAAHGIDLECVDLYQGVPAPDLSTAAGLVFMGGPMSVNDGLPWLELEMDLIRQAVDRQLPVFGVCLGAQLIAKALGAEVRRAEQGEIGWFEVQLTADAQTDPVFRDLDSPLPVFQWHNETFDLPPGATLLATSDVCRHQAFRVADRVYGIQFHPEVTPEMLADWNTEMPAPVDVNRHSQHLIRLSNTLFGRWATTLEHHPHFSR